MAGLPSINDLGLSGLLAAQRAISTTSHNIANVNTEGYSRQRVEFQARTPQTLTGFEFGRGVEVSSVKRVVDAIAVEQIVGHTASSGSSEHFQNLAERLDRVLADANTGLSPALGGFFSALAQVADSPSSASERQVLLSEGRTLADRFRVLDARFKEIDAGISDEVRATVDNINSLAHSIAGMNERITDRGLSAPQNDLLDQREQLVRKLAELTGVTTVEQDNGAIGVFTGRGHPLVSGQTVAELRAVANPYDPTRMEVGNAAGINITKTLSGGTLGGVLNFRDQVLDSAINALGRVATGLVEGFNAQHRLGMDFNGDLGTDFFSVGAPQITPNALNTGGSVSGAVVDLGGLTISDYTLEFNGGNAYTLTRETDNQTFAIDTGGVSPYTTSAIDGFALTITAGAVAGDTFKVRPVAQSVAQMSVLIASSAQVAAASPVRATAAITNSGDGLLSEVSIASVVNLPLSEAPVSGPLTVTFNATTNELTLVPDPLGEGPLAYDPATESAGKSFTILGGDISFTMSGEPLGNDTFTLAHNAGGVADNRNALALGDIQLASVLEQGTASLHDAYSQLVSEVGVQNRSAQIASETFAALLDQANIQRESASGVNLDEEAADLVRFQQAYQASARLLSVADELFQTILQAVRG
jgi:flagellar hook-associated protein 1